MSTEEQEPKAETEEPPKQTSEIIEPKTDKSGQAESDTEVFSSQPETAESPVYSDDTPVPMSPSNTPAAIPMNQPTPSYQPPTTEIKRSVALEERHLCICNLFYCFLFPLICRCSPIMDADIPMTMTGDRSEDIMTNLSPSWKQAYSDYLKKKQEFMNEHPDFNPDDKEASFVISFYSFLIRSS